MGPDDEADALRRRLYAPGATAADVARYRSAAVTDAPVEAEPRPPTVRRRPRLLPVAGLLGAVALATAVWAGTGARPRSAPTPTATVAPPIEIPVDRATRTRFLTALRDGTPAGLAHYLVTDPEAPVTPLSRVGRVGSDERWGDGPSSVELTPPGGADLDGRITVMLVTTRDGRASWTAVRDDDRDGRPPYQGAVGTRGGLQRAGVPTIAIVEYDAPAPVRLDIVVGDTVRWGVLVVFTE